MINKKALNSEGKTTNSMSSVQQNISVKSNNGYFKVWRDLFNKSIWLNSTPEQKSILFAVLNLANWQANTWEWKGKEYHCQRGEFISSYSKIAKSTGKGIGTQNVRTALKRFQNLDFLTVQSTGGYQDGIKVIINNWEIYQNETNRPANSCLTDYQQTPNSLLTPIEEYKNIRNKNILYSGQKTKFKKPSLEEIESYCSERKNNVDAQRFFDYYESVDWHIGKNKMKNWQACIRNWEKNTKNNYTKQEENTFNELPYNPYC